MYNISQEKMTFLTANYGLSPENISQFYEAMEQVISECYHDILEAFQSTGEEDDFYKNEEAILIETACDANRMDRFIPGDWIDDFRQGMELAHDLKEVAPPQWIVNYLEREGKTMWMLRDKESKCA